MSTDKTTKSIPQQSPFKTVPLHGARFRAVPAEPDQAYTHDILVDLDGGGHVASVAGGFVSFRARALIVLDESPSDHAFCMIPSATRAPLANRRRRREAGTTWL